MHKSLTPLFGEGTETRFAAVGAYTSPKKHKSTAKTDVAYMRRHNLRRLNLPQS
jgi:hypothetical protein